MCCPCRASLLVEEKLGFEMGFATRGSIYGNGACVLLSWVLPGIMNPSSGLPFVPLFTWLCSLHCLPRFCLLQLLAFPVFTLRSVPRTANTLLDFGSEGLIKWEAYFRDFIVGSAKYFIF